MNQAEFAKLHGVSRKTVTAWKARGWLVLDGEDIDVDASNERIRRYRKTVTRIKNEQKGNTLGNRVTSEGNTPGIEILCLTGECEHRHGCSGYDGRSEQ